MRKSVYFITFLMILLLAPNVMAQSLWHGTKYGMTEMQVKAVVPNAIPPLKPKHLYGGPVELLRLEDVTLVGEGFFASFYFNVGKLTQVTLYLERGRNFHDAMIVFDSLAEAFRSKYGPELNRSNTQEGILNRAVASWVSGQTNITILVMSVDNNDAILTINYQRRISNKYKRHLMQDQIKT